MARRRPFDLRTAAKGITSHVFGRSLLALKSAAELAALLAGESLAVGDLTVGGAQALVYDAPSMRMFWSVSTSGSTDASGDITITASSLSSITGGFGAQRNTTSDHRTTVHSLSGNTFKMRVRDSSGAVVASTSGVFYTAWAVGPPA